MPYKTLSREYSSWDSMRRRCLRPAHKDYPRYGGAGISICERWSNFSLFLQDMGPRPEGTSLDRRDTNGNYEPGNCRWADASTQIRNRRVSNSKLPDLTGQTFGRLKVATLLSRGGGKRVWLCLCSCGSKILTNTGNLNSRNTTSCGCSRRKPHAVHA